MSNRQLSDIKLAGSYDSGQGAKKYADVYPHGPFYPKGTRLLQNRYGPKNQSRLSDIFFNRVLARLGENKRYSHVQNPRKRRKQVKTTGSAKHWYLAISFQILENHYTFLFPLATDYKRENGTFAAQHIATFADTEDESLIENAADVMQRAFTDEFREMYKVA